jgi:hypothetical protein
MVNVIHVNTKHAIQNGNVPDIKTRKPVGIVADLTNRSNVPHMVKHATVAVKVDILQSYVDPARTDQTLITTLMSNTSK